MHEVGLESTEYYCHSFWFYVRDFKILEEPLTIKPPCFGINTAIYPCICIFIQGMPISLSKLGSTR